MEYSAGAYAAGLEAVEATVTHEGARSVCTFVPGFFEESLPKLAVRPAFVFLDVDYIDSARTCLRYSVATTGPGWPMLHARSRSRRLCVGDHGCRMVAEDAQDIAPGAHRRRVWHG